MDVPERFRQKRNFAHVVSARIVALEIFAEAGQATPTAAIADQRILMTISNRKKDFQELISKPFPVNISLEAPAVSFVISGLDKNPTLMEDEFREFLEKTFKEDLQLVFERKRFSVLDSKHLDQTICPAKIKWGLASFSCQEANGSWIVTIKAPLF